jgi:putative tryptophan/tyrosine transport system substrate-binding protein
MRRREFITLLGGAAAWPLAARAQQLGTMRRIGVLTPLAADDPEGQHRLATFLNSLRDVGWVDGHNVRVEARWSSGDTERLRQYAAELAALKPDVILATNTPAVNALQQVTRTIPIVFAVVIDPVGSGLVSSLAHPGGNATGFIVFEYALAAKWLELLKEIAPHLARVAVLRETTTAAGIGQFAAIQAVAPVGMELSVIDLGSPDEMDRAIASFADGPNGGLIVTASQFGASHPDVIAASAARHKLPAVYAFRYFADAGGLISYGSNVLDEYRRAAGYVDRILNGEKPAELPVQAPTEYELVINLKAAKALGISVGQSLLARADEVIE